MADILKIGLYLRLSKEDDVMDESNSIVNQRFLLTDFTIKEFKIHQFLEFVDDGFSGTNFNRPGVATLLEKVRRGEINCIIVKDFSRFSRNYIELGSYLEQIFPALGVRFISVNDNYDSINYQGGIADLDTSFKILMHDMYSKDLSLKVKSALKAKKEQGLYACGNTPFGFMKAPYNKHMLLVAEDEAVIIRRIVDMAEEGDSSGKIARIFNSENVKTPIEFRIEKEGINRKPKGEKFLWEAATISSILRNPVYAGDFVYGKNYKDEVGGKNHLKPRSEWKIFYNHHDAIVERERFNRLQLMRNRPKGTKKRETHPLQGKVICGCCRKALSIRHGCNPYFDCQKRYYNGLDGCVEKINIMFLEQYVLYRLQAEIMKHKDIEVQHKKEGDSVREKLLMLRKKKEDLERKRSEILMRRMKEYEVHVLQKNKEFQKVDLNISGIENAISEIEQEIERLEGNIHEDATETSQIENKRGATKLTKEVVDQFIRQIVVYSEQHIDIEWSFAEEMKVI